MEYKFEKNKMDLHVLREFCEREGEAVEYRKGDQLEREGDPARWFAFVTDGCFKYVNHSSDDKEQDHQHDPKGYHFRQGLATDFTKQQ